MTITLLREDTPYQGQARAVLPQHFDTDEQTMIKTGKKNPLPVANYVQINGVWLPAGDTNPASVTLSGSNAAKITSDGTSSGYTALVANNFSQYDNTYASPVFALATGGFPMNYNGSGWDRVRNNLQGTLLASAARTAFTTSALQTNYNSRGLMLFLDITAVPATPASGAGLTVVAAGVDPISSAGVQLNQGVTKLSAPAAGLYGFVIYPGVTSVGGSATSGQIAQFFNNTIPRTWKASVIPSTSDSYTYSLGYALIE